MLAAKGVPLCQHTKLNAGMAKRWLEEREAGDGNG